jgi:hypothetical protein
LINTNLVEDGGEFVAIFSSVNLLGICAENVNSIVLEAQRNILG